MSPLQLAPSWTGVQFAGDRQLTGPNGGGAADVAKLDHLCVAADTAAAGLAMQR
jgi:hypothetical protein